MKSVLVTGSAGFIGFFICQALLKQKYNVIGIDNLNSYYDVNLKKNRTEQLKNYQNFSFIELDIANRKNVETLFSSNHFDYIIHLAAQAGVRYSLDNPHIYVDSNLVGFLNILEGCRGNAISHLIYASSSSVYGKNKKIPFSTEDNVDHPISLYAATKKANELMAYTYSHLYDIPATGLRFFTVYGPWGRPDMAYFLFTKAILAGQPIKVFNHGKLKRDFTYINDVVEGIIRLLDYPPKSSKLSDEVPHKIYNIGNNQPVDLTYFIEVLESCLGKKAIKEYLPMQPGDVPITYANISELKETIGFNPDTPIEVGLSNFVRWYKSYYFE